VVCPDLFLFKGLDSGVDGGGVFEKEDAVEDQIRTVGWV
jgi:hypothetical protein